LLDVVIDANVLISYVFLRDEAQQDLAETARTPAIDTPPIRVVRLSDSPRTAGIETHVEHGVPLRVFSPAKTVADCFKFRSKVGIDVAIAALRDGWRQKRFTIDELWRFARVCRVGAVMPPYLEALAG